MLLDILLLIFVLLLPSGVTSTTSRWIIILNNESRVEANPLSQAGAQD
jgi:hypothetical protein